jgi:hypothetical protein
MTIERPIFPQRADLTLDLSYRRLEDRVNDLDRLCEITTDLVRQVCENPGDRRAPLLAATIAEIMHDRMREFGTTYYGWYEKPLRDGDDYDVIPSYVQHGAQA